MIEIGIDVQMISVERQLRRNTKMTRMTNTDPSMTASRTEAIDCSMNTALSFETDSCTPGTSRLMRATSRWTASEIATVFSPDCLVTRICTPGWPLTRVNERKSSVPSRTSAMSRM